MRPGATVTRPWAPGPHRAGRTQFLQLSCRLTCLSILHTFGSQPVERLLQTRPLHQGQNRHEHVRRTQESPVGDGGGTRGVSPPAAEPAALSGRSRKLQAPGKTAGPRQGVNTQVLPPQSRVQRAWTTALDTRSELRCAGSTTHTHSEDGL